ncbi:methionine ABC transporter ATP-binding protein [Gammaproteobacteria bacterium]|nr:methionine ABC transporter ATP-binding protein [Gammaproteobacteria bacterium]
MITFKSLCKNYITQKNSVIALSDINLHVNTGEIFGIIGKSGAGKSTLIRCANLLEKPTTGKIIIAGQNITKLSPVNLRKARQKIGMIFQHFNLLSSRTTYQNVALPLELAGHSKKQIASIITPLLELTGLTNKKNNYPNELSGGQKQRVAIARALANKPHILLSDEATSALDPETTLSILQLLKNIRDTLNITILLITHEMSVIKNCSDRVAILHNGKLIEENEVGEFFTHPKTDIAKSFISSSVLQHMPLAIEKHITKEELQGTHPVLRLWFLKGTATQPIISELSHRFEFSVNILQANVEYIKKHAMGIMIVALKGNKSKVQPAIDYLKQLGVEVEITGYVPDDIITFS